MSDNMPSNQEINLVLNQIKDPETGRSIIKTKQVYDTLVNGGQIKVDIGLTSHSSPVSEGFRQQVVDLLQQSFPGCSEFKVQLHKHDRKPSKLGQIGLSCKSVIAVGSGKGGVGKSTVATCLALALRRLGSRVGLMDADVYGPSIPQLTGAAGQPVKSGEKMSPIDYNGMPVMSIGFMVPANQAVIWRGPMLHSAVTQFLRDTDWGDLDYMIIDMPPGTGDVALSLSQLLPLTGAVVVCTPQKVALIDAIKAIAMFDKVNIPLLGIVENMSSFICPDNGKIYDIFGKGGARNLAEHVSVPLLGELPINIQIRERGDASQTADNFDDPQVRPYLEKMATDLVWEIARRAAEKPIQPDLPVLS